MFKSCTIDRLSYLHYEPWSIEGCVHGFLGRSDFSFEEALEHLKSAFNAKKVVRVKQIHSDKVVVAPTEEQLLEADALIVPTSVERCVAVVVTADCVPLLLKSGEQVALIHAGWRGLANGIIANTFEMMDSGTDIEILIGPCAGKDRYEVGNEVVDAIGERAKFQRISTEKVHLDLLGTAIEQLKVAGVSAERVHSANVCTMSEDSFYSYRREGKGVGKNISFMVIGD